jgi:hypothetical protein
MNWRAIWLALSTAPSRSITWIIIGRRSSRSSYASRDRPEISVAPPAAAGSLAAISKGSGGLRNVSFRLIGGWARNASTSAWRSADTGLASSSSQSETATAPLSLVIIHAIAGPLAPSRPRLGHNRKHVVGDHG